VQRAPRPVDEPGAGSPREGRPTAPVPLDLRAVALVTFLVLAVLATAFFARALLLPATIAILLDLLLLPLVRGLQRWHVPRPVAAAVVLAVLAGGAGYVAATVWTPATTWLRTASADLRILEGKLEQLRKPVEEVSRAAAEVERLTEVEGRPSPPEVQVRGRSPGQALLGRIASLALGGAIVFVLLFFLLAFGDTLLERLVKALPTLSKKKTAVRIARATEGQISRYLLTVASINLSLGAAVTLAMMLVGMPNPLLWGVLAATLNFVPYLGPVVCGTVIAFASIVTFPTLGRALVAPLAFAALTTMEGYFVTPIILGRRFRLNIIVLFAWLLLWGWLWGVGGALLAVPMLAVLKIVCDQVASLRPLGEFLGR
jgi:predicted PurR-regulated permease PerM